MNRDLDVWILIGVRVHTTARPRFFREFCVKTGTNEHTMCTERETRVAVIVGYRSRARSEVIRVAPFISFRIEGKSLGTVRVSATISSLNTHISSRIWRKRNRICCRHHREKWNIILFNVFLFFSLIYFLLICKYQFNVNYRQLSKSLRIGNCCFAALSTTITAFIILYFRCIYIYLYLFDLFFVFTYILLCLYISLSCFPTPIISML